MLTKEETLVATLATQIYIHRKGIYAYNRTERTQVAVNEAKLIIEASKETEPKAGLTPIQRKGLVRKVKKDIRDL